MKILNKENFDLKTEITRLFKVAELLFKACTTGFFTMFAVVWCTEYTLPLPAEVQRQIETATVFDLYNSHKLRLFRGADLFYSLENPPEITGRNAGYTLLLNNGRQQLSSQVFHHVVHVEKEDGSVDSATTGTNTNLCGDRYIITREDKIVVFSEYKANGSSRTDIALADNGGVLLTDTTYAGQSYLSAYIRDRDNTVEEGFIKYDYDGRTLEKYILPPGYIVMTQRQRKELGIPYDINIARMIYPAPFITYIDPAMENILYSCHRPIKDGYKEFTFVYNIPTGWIGIPTAYVYSTGKGSKWEAFVAGFETAPETAHIPRPYRYAAFVMDDGRPRRWMTFDSEILPRALNKKYIPYSATIKTEKDSAGKEYIFTLKNPNYNWKIRLDFAGNTVEMHDS